jgi:ribose 5-phosphate isomerase B
MRIAVGSDHRGVEMRAKLIEYLKGLGQEVVDSGPYAHEGDDYPDIAETVARKVANQEADRGILICGSGMGMCIVANKIPGVRAAPCFDDLSAEISRRHNDLNVLCLSGDLMGEMLADRIVEIWLNTPFDGGRHARRNQKIANLEHRNGHL